MVRLGDQNLLRSDDGAQPVEYSIEKVVEHKNYSRAYRTNDIALIKLMKAVTFTRFIRPACLHQGETIGKSVIAVSRRKSGSDIIDFI